MFKQIINISMALMMFSLIAVGCGSDEMKEEDTTNFDKLSWLKGRWEGSQGDVDIHESWNGVNYRIMEGVSYTTQDEARLYSQSMRIEQSNNKIFLTLTFRDRKDQFTFDLADLSEDRAVFVNREDAYPKKIIYEKDGDKMHVTVEGDEGNNEAKYDYKKISS